MWTQMCIGVRPKKKKGCLFPFFRPTQNFKKKKKCCFFILNFAFLNQIVRINFSKYIISIPKVYCVGTEGICLYTIHVSTRLFDVTYLNTEMYMIYITFLQHQDLKKNRPSDPPNFQPKRPNKHFLNLIDSSKLYETPSHL